MKSCDCVYFLEMHDENGICNNWEQHDGKPCAHYRGLLVLARKPLPAAMPWGPAHYDDSRKA